MVAYIVWNASRTEGFVTTDQQLAYEVHKSSFDNCYDVNGRRSNVAAQFCDDWVGDACTIEELKGGA